MILKPALSVLLFLSALLSSGCVINLPLGPAQRGAGMELETIEEPEHFYTLDKVLMIPLVGTVDVGGDGGVFSKPGMLVSLRDRLDAARDNDEIKAVLLKIDSPGGSVTASDLIHHEIMEFKKDKDIPVIAMMNGVAASGGLYAAMAADEVYAIPTTITGSIGVIAMMPNIAGLGSKIGFEMNVIKSGALKDAGSPFRKMNDADRAIFENLIGTFYDRFFGIVLESRRDAGMTEEGLKAIADGRVLTLDQALEAKLIDGVGYPGEIVEIVKEKAGLDDAALVTYEYSGRYRGHIYAKNGGAAPASATQLNLLNVDLGGGLGINSEPQFLYLWMP